MELLDLVKVYWALFSHLSQQYLELVNLYHKAYREQQKILEIWESPR